MATATATTTTLQRRLTNSIDVNTRGKKSRWTIQYEFKLWRFGAYQEVHTSHIGPNAVPFILHTNLLRDRCPPFYRELVRRDPTGRSAASRYETEEAGSFDELSTVSDPRDIDVRMFQVFSTWLYTGRLVQPDECVRIREVPRLVALQAHKVIEAAGSWQDEDLVDVYMFASRHEIWELANLAITKLWTQNGQHRRTTSLPAIKRAFQAGAFGWEDSLGNSGPNQKPWLARLQDYLLYEAARALDLIKDSWLDLLLTAHMFPHPYSRAVHTRYHEPARAIEHQATDRSRPFWEYEPCYFHYHANREDQKTCAARYSSSTTMNHDSSPVNESATGAKLHQMFRDTCTVLLGRGRVPFILHKELACQQSAFFKSVFGDIWHGPPNSTISLVREQPRDFALFAIWLYSQEITLPTIMEAKMHHIFDQTPRISKSPKLKCPKSAETGAPNEALNGDSDVDVNSDSSTSTKVGHNSDNSDEEPVEMDEIPTKVEGGDQEPACETNEARFLSRKHQQDLINLYALAGRMKVPDLANAVMDKFIEQREKGHPYASSSPDNLRLAYKLCLPDSKLCSFFIQEAAFTYRGLPRDRSGYAQLLPPQFLHDLLEYQFTKGIFPKLREHVPSWRTNLCEFHEHADESAVQLCLRTHAVWQNALKAKGSEWEPVARDFHSRYSLIGVLDPQQLSSASKGFPAPGATPSKRSPPRPATPASHPSIVPPLPSSDVAPGSTPALPTMSQVNSSTASNESRASTATVSSVSSPSVSSRSSEMSDDDTKVAIFPLPPSTARYYHASRSSDYEPKRPAPKPPVPTPKRNSNSSETESIECAVRLAERHEAEAKMIDIQRVVLAAPLEKQSSKDEYDESTPPPTPIKDIKFFASPPVPPKSGEVNPETKARHQTPPVHNPPKPPIQRPSIPLIISEHLMTNDYQASTPPSAAKNPTRRQGIEIPLEREEEAQRQVQASSAKATHFSRHRVAARMSRLRPFTHPREPQQNHVPTLIERESQGGKGLRTSL